MPSALTGVLLGWIAGVMSQLQQPALDNSDAYGRLVLLAVAGLGLAWLLRVRACSGRARNGWRTVALVAASASLGWGVTGWHATEVAQHRLRADLQGQDLHVTGIVGELPQRTERGTRLRLEVEQAQDADGVAVRLPPRLALTWYAVGWDDDALPEQLAPPASLQPGQRWRLQVRLKQPHGGANPHGFDHELWMWEQDLHASGYVRNGKRDAPPRLLAEASNVSWDGLRWQVRERILAHVPDERQAGVLAALVVGDQNAIARDDWDVFRATGVAHLVAISGLHITMFAWLAQHLLGWLWRRSVRLCLWCSASGAGLSGGVLLAALYARFSGWGVPSQRTVLMLAAVSLLRLSGARWPWHVTWLMACALVLATDPWAALQAGFWLSFVAVGILFATDSGAPSEGATGVRGRLMGMLREQGIITVALTPLSLLLFGQVSLVSLLANLLAIPMVTLLITPLAMLGVLWSPWWTAAGEVVAMLMQWLQGMASLPWARLWIPQAPLELSLLACVGGVVLVLRLPWSIRLLALPLVLPALWWQPAPPVAGALELLAADVGQGSAVLLRTTHHALLYDAGPRYGPDSDAGQRVLVPLLRALGWQLDGVVLSHRDSDHTGGAAAVLAQQPQAWVLVSDPTAVPGASSNPVRDCRAGVQWQWDDVRFTVLHPVASGISPPARKTNASSCVLRVQGSSGSVLLTGDLEQAQESALLGQGVPLATDLLVLGHHGSKSSSSTAWLDAVQPRLALAQSGYRNSYGHPADVVRERLQQRGLVLLDTSHCGALHWQSDRPDHHDCERQRRMHYWQHTPE